MAKRWVSAVAVIVFGFVLMILAVPSNQKAEGDANVKIASYSVVLAENYENVNDFYQDAYSETDFTEEQRSAMLNTDGVYEVGKNIAVSEQEIQQYVDYYTVQEGMNDEDALAAAKKDAEQRSALYAEAMKNGYSVTDEEIYAWLDELKAALEEDTTGVYQAAMQGFESEEAYWEYEYKVYTVDLPIQKYASANRQEFCGVDSDEGVTVEAYNQWQNSYEQLKEQLVEAQNFQTAE